MKRIIALAGVIILALLYVITLIAAIADSTATMDFFRASVAATILIPAMLYIYMMVYKWQQGKNSENKETNNNETNNKKD